MEVYQKKSLQITDYNNTVDYDLSKEKCSNDDSNTNQDEWRYNIV